MTIGTRQKVKNQTSWHFTKSKNIKGFSTEVPSSLFVMRDCQWFVLIFFIYFIFSFKSAPWGERLQGRAACAPVRTVHPWFLHLAAIKTRWQPGVWGWSWAGELKSGTVQRSSHPFLLALVTRDWHHLRANRWKCTLNRESWNCVMILSRRLPHAKFWLCILTS